MNTFRNILMIIGTLALIFFVLMDRFGLGEPGFDYWQLIGAGGGVILVLIGLVIRKRVSTS